MLEVEFQLWYGGGGGGGGGGRGGGRRFFLRGLKGSHLLRSIVVVRVRKIEGVSIRV